MNEKIAIAKLKQGDINGLEMLMVLYQVRAARTAFLIIGDSASAEDVVQSSFLRAYAKIRQFDEQKPFAPWFFRIVTNTSLKVIKQRKRYISLDADDRKSIVLADILADFAPSPHEHLENIEADQFIWDTLNKLPTQQRTAIVLRYYLGLTDEEIAKVMESPVGTIRWRLHSARNKLRNLLSDWFYFENIVRKQI